MRRILFILLVITVSGAQAEDLEELTQAFRKACGDRLQILDQNVAQGEDKYGWGQYWILRLHPKEVGRYSITHRCSNSIGVYSMCKRVYRFQVAPPQAKRTFMETYWREDISPEARLGDGVILVLDISSIYQDHEFSLNFMKPESKLTPEETKDVEKKPFAVANPIDDRLSCVSVERRPLLLRGLTKIPVHYLLLSFEAKKPAKFNVNLSVYIKGAKRADYSMPVLIVGKDKALDVLVSRPFTARDYNPNGGSSGSDIIWRSAGQEAFVLRVGDVLQTAEFFDYHTNVPYDNTRVVVQELPFKPKDHFIHNHIKWKSNGPSEKKAAANKAMDGDKK